MRSLTVLVLAALLLSEPFLSGCSSTEDPSTVPSSSAVPSSAPATAAPSTSSTTSAVPAALPPVPQPATAGSCPYLASPVAADLNGQRVASVRLDTAYDPPACFFLIGNGTTQLSVWVYRAPSAALATAVVNRAAPVASSDPADAPAGWIGGRQGGAAGAVYAVAKGATAVVVTSNQEQSLKAQRVTEEVISALTL